MSYPITNVRKRMVHYSCGDVPKPQCKPTTRVLFHRTLIERDMKTCETCAQAELRAQYAAGKR